MAATLIGNVESISGNVTVVHSDGSSEILQNNSLLYLHDVLAADGQSHAQVRLINNSLLDLHAGETLVLESDYLTVTGFENTVAGSDAAVAVSAIGVVTRVEGTVEVMRDGKVIALHPGDFVYTGDVLQTATDASTTFTMLDGSKLEFGPDSRATLNDDLFSSRYADFLGAGVDDPAAIQAAILAGQDPSRDAPAPGAGQATGNEGHTFIQIDASGRAVTPESGHETHGQTLPFNQTQEELLQNLYPDVSIGDGVPDPAVEGTDGSITFTVSLTNASAVPVTVAYQTVDGSAVAGSDYTGQSGTLTFAAGQTSQTITVAVLDDQVFEDPESFQVVISNADASGTALVISDATGVGGVVDTDAPVVSIGDGVPDPAVEGTDGSITFTVSLTNASAVPVTVAYQTVDGSAVAGSDYTGQSGTLTFAAGQTSQTITVAVLDDQVFEDPESFQVVISNADASGTALVISDATGVGGVVDTDAPVVSIGDGVPDPAVEGTDGSITFTVSLTNASAVPVTVAYQTVDGSAVAGSDYTGQSGTLTFAAGQTSQTITVAVLDDQVFEDPESFQVVISNADASGTALVISDATGVGGVVDTDAPVVSIGDGVPDPAVEGTDGSITFTVSLTNASAVPVTVAYQTVDGSAVAGSDYTGQSGTLTFAAGQTSQTITVAVLDDQVFEDPESFQVVISNADASGTALVISDATGVGGVVDTDAPVVSIGDGVPDPAVEGTDGSITFTVSLTNASAVPVTVAYQTVDGSAVAGSDYTGQSGTLTFAAGQTSQTITVAVLDDQVFEDPESFQVVISNADASGTALVISDATGVGGVVDTDAPVVSIGDGVPDPAVEGTDGSITFTVSLTNASAVPVTVAYQTVDGSAVAGSDYTGQSGTLTFAAGQTSQTITVAVLDDQVFEDPESFQVVISNADASGTALVISDATGVGGVVDTDAPVVSIGDGVPDPAVEGTDGSITFTVSLTNASAVPVTVAYQTVDGSAVAGSDYTGQSGTLTFAAGQTSQTITVAVLDDQVFEDPESFQVVISNADASGTALVISDATGVGGVVDTDAPVVSIGDGVPDPAVEGTDGSITFTVSLTNASAVPVTVAYQTVDGSAVAGSDYTGQSGTLTFAAGQTSQTITVAVLDDQVFEDPESFQVVISNADASGTALVISDATGVGGVVDTDAPVVSIGDGVPDPAVEGTDGSITFTVSLTNASAVPVTVAYQTVDGSAVAGSDYTGQSGTLTFAAGQTSQTITVAVLDDQVFEDPESFQVVISNADASGTALVISDATGVGGVVDTDAPVVSIGDGVPDPAVEGTDGSITFTVSLTNASAVPVTVAYQTVDGSAVAGSDYTGQSGTLTFAAGQTSQTITVAVLDDQVFEDPESFQVVISNADASGTALVISDATGVGGVVDTDAPVVSIGDGVPDPAVEGTDGSITFTVSLTNASAVPVTVAYQTVDGSAVAGSDYTGQSGTLTFAAGQTSQTITVAVLDDQVFEDPESFQVVISNADASGTALVISDATGVGGVVDTDAPVVSIGDGVPDPAVEGTDGSITFTVSLTNASAVPVTVAYQTVDGSAVAGSDYTGQSGTLTFAAGQTSQTITVAVLDDQVFEDPESFQVVISNADASGTALVISDATGVGGVVDTDAPVVSIGDGVPDPAVEGTDGSITFTVSLTNASAVPVTVAYQTVDGSAVAGSDYTGQSGTLTFAAGQTSQTITVAVLDDQVFEDPESFQVVISNADASGTALVISDATGVGSIRDTDAPTIFAVYNNNGIVDEKGLPEGSGELLDGNALNNSDASETTGGYFTIDAGANGPDKFEVMDSNGNWIEVTSGGTISGVNGTLTINENNGAYTWSYTLETNLLTHNDTSTTDGDSDRGAADQVMGEAFQIRVMDSEGDVSVPKTLDITVNDDGPSDFNPTPVILVNSGDGSGSGPLDMFAHMGADGLGSVVFTGGNDGDLLTGLLNGNTVAEPIMYKNETIALTGYGTGTLTGISSVTDTQILKIELNPDTADESADQYTITFFTDINDGSGFVFDDFSSAPAGQNKWIGLDRDGLDINNPTDPEPDSVDLLITAFSGNSIATINTSSKDIGVDNQWMDGDQGIRIDFVTDVRRDTAAGENEKDAQGFLYDTHSASNNLSFEVMQVQGGGTAAIRVLAYDFTGVEGDTDVNNPLKNTAVPIIAGSLLVNGVAASTLAGVTVTVDGNSIVIDGLSQGDNVYFEAVSDFESIQLSNADGQPDGQGGSYIGDPFAVGSFGFDTVIEGDQVAIAFDLLATDADGDVSNGTLDIIISPDGHVAVGTDADEVLIGDSHVDFLVGGGGDDILIGNDENDTMTGGTGADVFIWTAGQSGTDLITDFNIVEGDVLDIADLLTGVQNPTATDLEGYMSIASGSDTTITIFGDNGAADQIIQLNGYDTSNMTGAEIIENLLGSGNLLAG